MLMKIIYRSCDSWYFIKNNSIYLLSTSGFPYFSLFLVKLSPCFSFARVKFHNLVFCLINAALNIWSKTQNFGLCAFILSGFSNFILRIKWERNWVEFCCHQVKSLLSQWLCICHTAPPYSCRAWFHSSGWRITKYYLTLCSAFSVWTYPAAVLQGRFTEWRIQRSKEREESRLENSQVIFCITMWRINIEAFQ